FSISNVPDNAKTLVVTYVGMNPVEAPITAGEMKIEMTSSTQDLDEVVVVAYGAQKKSSITGAISQVKSEDLEKRPVTSVGEALEGSTPGITVTASYGSPGEDPTIRIRGIGTVNGSASPLYVIDGVPYGGNLSDINMDDIESMSVLKDAASAALYGNRASNGVILITTKKSKSERITFNFKTNQGWYERALPEYERTNAKQFMEVEYQNYANAWLYDTAKTGGAAYFGNSQAPEIFEHVNSTIISGNLYFNIFNKADDALFNTNGTMVADAQILPEIAGDLDWFDQATRKGYRQEYVFSGQGATDKSDYYFSLSYLDENGYMKDSGFNRLTGRTAINIRPTKWFKSGLSLQASHQKFQNTSNGVGDGSSSINNPFNFCRYIAPIYPVHTHYVESGTIYNAQGQALNVERGQFYVDGEGNHVYDPGSYLAYNANGDVNSIATRNQLPDRNVIWESQLNSSRTIRNTMNGIGYIDLILPYGFTASVKGNLNTRNSDYYSYSNATIGDAKGSIGFDGKPDGRNGSLSKTLYTYKNWTLQEQLRWNMDFDNGKHVIEALVGHENYSYRYDYTYTAKQNEAFPNVYALSNFSQMSSISGYKVQYRTESYLARVQYAYNDRYNVEASFRRDGSSRFAKESRWGNFGSVGANWIFSNEDFFRQFHWLNNGKLRADWGQVGNDAGSDYYSYYRLFGAWTENSLPAYILTQNPAPHLKWETGQSWGIALETRLFNRLNFTVEYYNKLNKDLIFNVYAPSSAGSEDTGSTYSTTPANIGSIVNRGWEIAFDVDIFKNKDWSVNFGANISTLTNKVTKLPEQNKKVTTFPINPSGVDYPRAEVPAGILSGNYFIKEGGSRYDWYTYHWAGVDEMDGRSLYEANLTDYYIVLPDGSQLGGKQALDVEGNPRWDKDGNPVQGGTQLTPDNYRLINGKYYVVNNTYAEKAFRGKALPTAQGAFNASVSWKNLNVSAMFTYSIGGKIYDSVYSSLMSVGEKPGNYSTDILNSWKPTLASDGLIATYNAAYDAAYDEAIANGASKTNAQYAGYKAGNAAIDSPNRINPNINNEINFENNTQNTGASDRWLISRSYLQFKNINISYSFPRNLVRKIDLQALRLSFSAENIHMWSARKGMNPMMSMSGSQSNYLVPSRVFTFGLNITI
ncbi:MAG: SusC/RagA family TonB-linked outer membrane protein, partial [Bacteroidales bacterium]|nr:SusC/RagA family TonB-linked outer membrane protein [Bacteroidales bacterium]